MSEIQKAISDLVNDTFTTYRGCLIEKGAEGFLALQNWYPSIELAMKAIDESFQNIKKSIR